MGTTVSLSSSPEPEQGTPIDRIRHILEQKPLRMAPMLRLSRILNDSSSEEKLKFQEEIGIIEKICEMVKDFSPVNSQNQSPSGVQGGNRKGSDLRQKRKTSSSLPNIRGVGFGFGTTKSRWDMEKAVEERMAQEEYLIWLLNALTSYLYCASPDFSDPEEILEKICGSNLVHINEKICSIITSSAIYPLIDYHLRNDSIFDVSEHMEFYQALFEVCCSMALCPHLLRPLVIVPDSQGTTTSIIEDLIPKFRESLSFYLDSPKAEKLSRLLQKFSYCFERLEPLSSDLGQVASPDFRLIDFIHKVQQWSDLLYFAAKNTKTLRSGSLTSSQNGVFDGARSNRTSISEAEGAREGDQENAEGILDPSDPRFHSASLDRELAYTAALKPLKVTTWKFIGDYGKLVVSYAFKKEAKNLNPFSPAMKDRTKRIVKELASLQTSLPSSYSNSIFVCVDESRCDIMKVLIIGPEDTPYQNGAFEFDIFFPSSYPYSPPKVSFLTTGNQTVRFNPNLYADGKVCLSILGTWEGRPEEKWNPYCSLLQILISIQGLIFVKDPYFNEPGFERHMGTSKGKEYSKKYNLQIEHATLHYAIRGQLREPPSHFAAIIKKHFWYKRGQILDQSKKWKEHVQTEVAAVKNTNTKGSGSSSNSSEVFEINMSTLKTMEKTVDLITDELLIMSPP